MIRYIHTLINYRELLYFLVMRDIKAKYKQTVLGVSWAVLQPLSLMLVFTVVFSIFAQIPSDGLPYAAFSYCALLPWQFFAGALNRGVGSLLGSQGLIQKVYFPREIIVLAVVASSMVDFAIGVLLLAGLLSYFNLPMALESLWILPVFLIQVCFVVGLILILAPLNVFYRDIGLVIPLVIQLWMYATPIIYPVSLVPAWLRPYYALNPMAGVIDAYRKILLHHSPPDFTSLSVAAGVSSLALVAGLLYFKRVEFKLADVM